MNAIFRPSVSDDDMAGASLFFLERKYDLHPSFTTLGMLELLYGYMTRGHLFCGFLPDGSVIAGAAYYLGTPEREYADQHVALIDITILDRAYRSSTYFLHGLTCLIDSIQQQHPEVREVRFVALSENTYLCRLYAKFAAFAYKREGHKGEETVFIDRIEKIVATLKKYRRI